MKCVSGKNETCRRCQRAGLPCVFVPRANAAALPDLQLEISEWQFKQNVLQRLKAIEVFVGMPTSENSQADDDHVAADQDVMDSTDDLAPLWQSLGILKDCSPNHIPSAIWQKSLVKSLLASYVGTDFIPGPLNLPIPDFMTGCLAFILCKTNKLFRRRNPSCLHPCCIAAAREAHRILQARLRITSSFYAMRLRN